MQDGARAMRLAILTGVMIMALNGAQASVIGAVEAGDHGQLSKALAAHEPLEARNAKGQTALLVAVWKNDLAAATLLIDAGADVNAFDQIKDSPYLVAGAQGRTDILRLILAHGADLKSTNRFGGTALIPAAEKGHLPAVEMLLAAGVDPNHVNDLGWTALLEAIILTDGSPVYQQIVATLLAGGADPSIADFEGVTPLQHARARGFTKMVTLIEAANAGK